MKLCTINIEGVYGNSVCLQSILSKCDIVFIQEHWLWQFESKFLETFDNQFDSHVKANDCYDPIVPIDRRHARGGTAIMWKSDLTPYISRLEDGDERIVCIALERSTEKWCFISVYPKLRVIALHLLTSRTTLTCFMKLSQNMAKLTTL
jgi:hypothetical protein